jgi:hypothetical protein
LLFAGLRNRASRRQAQAEQTRRTELADAITARVRSVLTSADILQARTSDWYGHVAWARPGVAFLWMVSDTVPGRSVQCFVGGQGRALPWPETRLVEDLSLPQLSAVAAWLQNAEWAHVSYSEARCSSASLMRSMLAAAIAFSTAIVLTRSLRKTAAS